MMTPVIPLKERQRQERRAEILRAARDVFLVNGYSGTNVDEVAERAGVGKGTIYLHFPSKDDLLIALWQEAAADLGAQLTQVTAAPGDSLQKVEDILRLFSDFFGRNVDLFMSSPEVKAAILEHIRDGGKMRELFGQIADVIRSGIAEGSISSDVDPTVAAAMLPALAQVQVRIRDWIRDESLDQASVCRSVLRIYLQGICATGYAPSV